MSAQVATADKLDYFGGAFVSGNDLYQWCRGNRPMALAYTAALADSASHSVWVLEISRPIVEPTGPHDSPVDTNINSVIDFGVERIAAYCRPSEATLDQVTDVICNYLRDTPEKRHGLNAILFNDAMTKAWPCR
jgi:hypothetical protein